MPEAASPLDRFPFAPRAKKVPELAGRMALRFGHNDVGIEHFLLAILSEREGVWRRRAA